MRGLIIGCALASVAAAASGCFSGTFACQTDDQCGAGGLCEGTGYCSFEDDACGSGRRYGELSPPDLAGRCVGEDIGTSSETSPTTDAPVTSSPDTEMTGTPSECAPGQACFDAPPPGWSGPVKLEFDVGSCPPDAPDSVVEAFAELDWPDELCTCECQPTYDCTAIGFYNPAGACLLENPVPVELPFDECQPVADWLFAPNTNIVIDWQETLIAPQCAAVGGVPDFSEPQWLRTLVGCGVGVADPCGAGTCLAEGSAPTCIYAEADQPCPAGLYTARTVGYRGYEDTRFCDTCTCEPRDTNACILEIYDGGACSDGVVSLRSLEKLSCVPISDLPTDAYLQMQQEDICDSVGFAATLGQVTEVDPVTFCCDF